MLENCGCLEVEGSPQEDVEANLVKWKGDAAIVAGHDSGATVMGFFCTCLAGG